jgi:hypothetical protein
MFLVLTPVGKNIWFFAITRLLLLMKRNNTSPSTKMGYQPSLYLQEVREQVLFLKTAAQRGPEMVDEDRFGGRPIPGRLAAHRTGGHASHTSHISYHSTSGSSST